MKKANNFHLSDNNLRAIYVAITVLTFAVAFMWLGLQIYLPADGSSGKLSSFTARGFMVRRALTAATPLRAGDVIIAAAGYSIEEWLRGTASVPEWRHGAVVSYTIDRAGQERTVSVTLTRLSIGEILQEEWTVIVIILGMMALVFFIAWQQPRDRAAQLLFAGAYLMIVHLFRDFADFQFSALAYPLFFWGAVLFEHLTFALSVSCMIHALFIFPERKEILRRYPQLLWINYIAVPISILIGAALAGDSLATGLGASDRISVLVAGIQVAFGIGSVVHSYFTARTPRARDQIRWFVWGTVLGGTPLITLYFLPIALRGQPIIAYEIAAIPMSLVPISLVIAITRHQLFDIEVIINRSLVYATLTAILLGVYVGLTSILSRVLPLLSGAAPNSTISFLSTMSLVIVFTPAKNWTQELIDRTFYRSKLSFQRLQSEINRELATTLVYDDLDYLLTQLVPQRLAISHAHLLVLDTAHQQYRAADYTLSQTAPLVRHLQAENDAVVVSNAEDELARWVAPLREWQIELCIPLNVGGELVGLYLFGCKLSKQFYSRDEIRILAALSYQAAVAVENILLSQRLAAQERIKHDLEIARQIQVSLLPLAAPSMPGLDIAGMSLPAREVGGDFYDYFVFAEGCLGIAVGDVSGKGIQAALMMSLSVGMLTTEIQIEMAPAQLLTALNMTLRPHTKRNRMNTALGYVILESAIGAALTDNRWNIYAANAGLLSPLLRTSEGEVRWIEAAGLPLGMMEGIKYAELCETLVPEDVLLLCSDGIVEAQNAHEELYGFERFAVCVARAPRGSAREIQEWILADVREFVGGAEQHDDMTVVVVRVMSEA